MALRIQPINAHLASAPVCVFFCGSWDGYRGHLEKIEFIIRPGGRVEQKVIGVKGSKCMEITKAIEESLGQVVHDEKTQEYYETPNEQQLDLEVKEDIPTW
mmetsp:Transcript_33313/g.131260  ORF Transcript_33313/g.131260 Transcript_33313/m.131260 type:complete len:101 (+) Transcript_33313:119-421(+)